MNYDDWKSTERDDEPRRITAEPVHECSDCGEELGWYAVSVPTGDGGRRYCASCSKWRSVHGLLFDPRPRHVLESAIA